MHAVWHWLLHLLTWASADPGLLEHERARAAGCVVVAYAALATASTANVAGGNTSPERVAQPAVPATPPLPPAAPCVQCSGTGRIYRSDGGWVRCPCGACPNGRCKPAKVLP